jgi:thioredoxin 1
MFWKRRKRKRAVDIHESNITEIIRNNDVVYIFFKAPWCGACKILSPLVHELADDNRGRPIVIGQVHTDNEKGLVERYKIQHLPTLIVFQNGEVVYKGTGMISKPRLQEMINTVIA